MNKARIKWIDFAKGITMLFIFNTHFPNHSQLFPWGRAFHVATYFMLSGILMAERREELCSVKEFVTRKSKGLLWPYFTVSLVSSLFVFFWYLVQGELHISMLRNWLLLNCCGFGNGTFWFLSTAFGAEIIVFLIQKKCSMKTGICIGIVFFCVNMILVGYLSMNGYSGYQPGLQLSEKRMVLYYGSLGLLRIPVAFGFMLTGFVADRLFAKRKQIYSRLVTGGISVICTVLLVLWLGPSMKGYDLHYAYIPNPIAYTVTCLTGCVMIITLSYTLESVKFLSDGLQWMGRSSLYVMTTHYDFRTVNLVYYILVAVGMHHETHRILFGLAMFGLLIPIEIVLTLLIQYTPLKWLYQFPLKRTSVKKV